MNSILLFIIIITLIIVIFRSFNIINNMKENFTKLERRINFFQKRYLLSFEKLYQILDKNININPDHSLDFSVDLKKNIDEDPESIEIEETSQYKNNQDNILIQEQQIHKQRNRQDINNEEKEEEEEEYENEEIFENSNKDAYKKLKIQDITQDNSQNYIENQNLNLPNLNHPDRTYTNNQLNLLNSENNLFNNLISSEENITEHFQVKPYNNEDIETTKYANNSDSEYQSRTNRVNSLKQYKYFLEKNQLNPYSSDPQNIYSFYTKSNQRDIKKQNNNMYRDNIVTRNYPYHQSCISPDNVRDTKNNILRKK